MSFRSTTLAIAVSAAMISAAPIAPELASLASLADSCCNLSDGNKCTGIGSYCYDAHCGHGKVSPGSCGGDSPSPSPTPSPAPVPPHGPPSNIHDVGRTAWVYGTSVDLTAPTSPGKNIMGKKTFDDLKKANVDTPILYGVDVFDGSLDACASKEGTSNPAMSMADTFKQQGFKKVFASVSAGVNKGDICPLVDGKAVAQKVHACFGSKSGIDGIVFDFEHDCKITEQTSRDLVVEAAKLFGPAMLLTFQDFNPPDLTDPTIRSELQGVKTFFAMVIMYDYGDNLDYCTVTQTRLETIMADEPKSQLPFTLSLPISKGEDAAACWIQAFKAQKIASNANFVGLNLFSFDPNTDTDSSKAAALAKAIGELP